MQVRTPEQSRPIRRPIAARGIAAGVLAVAFALVLLLPALGSAAQPAVTTLKAPYKTATVILSNPASHTGGGRTLLVTGAFFNKTTGVGGFSDNVSAALRATSTNNSALATGEIQVNLPITISTTGKHTLQAVWITVATGSVNLTSGSCKGNASIASSSCTRFAQAFVHGFAILLDKTNGSQIRVQNWVGNFTSVWANTTCKFLTCTTVKSSAFTGALHTGTAFWSWDWTSVSLVSTHKYTMEMFLFGGAQVTLSATGATLKSASGNAQLNSGTHGNDEVLFDVSVN